MRPKNGRASFNISWPMPPAPTRPSVRAGEAKSHEILTIVPAAGLYELVLLEQTAGQSKEHRQCCDRDRPAHRQRCIGDDDAFRGGGGNIDIVVADAVAGYDFQPAIVTAETFRTRARSSRSCSAS